MMRISAALGIHADRNSLPVPPGTPWLADPVLTAWERKDPEQQALISRGLVEILEGDINALSRAGIEIADLASGLVAFPSFLEGKQEVRLRWRFGQAEITHYCPRPGDATSEAQHIEGRRFTAELRSSDEQAP